VATLIRDGGTAARNSLAVVFGRIVIGRHRPPLSARLDYQPTSDRYGERVGVR
jgi:hypothetical protein